MSSSGQPKLWASFDYSVKVYLKMEKEKRDDRSSSRDMKKTRLLYLIHFWGQKTQVNRSLVYISFNLHISRAIA